ncbi:Translation initiation factor IF-2 [Labeo rohita]|uniref:Translation initiation factor IF-2 n=1 Tax=Labeo rohita TaxID=84645 RepID=A0ABQ8L366_LABRO|nr:Translation initiation factor IF-2 [Labeo rohita]
MEGAGRVRRVRIRGGRGRGRGGEEVGGRGQQGQGGEVRGRGQGGVRGGRGGGRGRRVMELEADVMGHEQVFVDEAGFNLTKTRKRGRNFIGHRAIINVPGQRGGNITMCAAISQNGVVHHHATLGPYNTAHIITFLDTLHDMLTNVQRPEQTRYVIIWDNITHSSLYSTSPPYSPFLNPIEEFFSAWRWKVYDRHPHQRMALLQAMEEACGDIDQASCQAWIRHSRRYFPQCLGLEDIACLFLYLLFLYLLLLFLYLGLFLYLLLLLFLYLLLLLFEIPLSFSLFL